MLATPRSEESIFSAALELSEDAREDFVQNACGTDSELRHRVDQLLKSHQGAGSFLRDALAVTQAAAPLVEGPGTTIGRYKLLQKIGEGGMGVVYMADQESPVRRRVALKVIKPGMDCRDVIARFEAERQALAMMDHQNIARVLDAGTTDSDRPYFVMELVHGVPLTKFCDDSRLTLKQRLELFVPVCQAIQHAHQKGVIHRDIKPTNILVTMYDDKPVPKVIDFGVAKAIEQRLTEKTLFTHYGTLVGTFEYMSPEQAEMNALGVDTRSDVYSLGVLLYELLTGTTPLERQRLRKTALQELLRIIKEEEPPRPSVRLSTSVTLPQVAASCRAEPAQLPQLVRGELDWIVMKCLEKDRTRRYETANGLARDVQRYLTDEPVEACPPSLTYRFRKFARKHRGLLTTAALFVACLMCGVVISTAFAVWAVQSQRLAQTARAAAIAARSDAEAALARERLAREQAEAATERAEGFTQRLRKATQIANDGLSAVYCSNWQDAYQRFHEAQELEPDLWATFANRSLLFTKLGLWERAVDDYDRRFQLVPRSHSQGMYEHALLKLSTGDLPGYRQVCANLLQQHGPSRGDQALIVRACTLSSDPAGDPADLVRRSENLLASQYSSYHLQLAGRAYLRAGNYEKAARLMREGLDRVTNTPGGVHRCGNLLLAIALQRLGKTAEAEQALAAAEQAIDGWTKEVVGGSVGTWPIDWWDWLEAHYFYQEARTLLSGTPPVEDPRLVTIRERALAVIVQGDADTFMQKGRKLVKRQAWGEAAASFAKVLDNLSEGFSSWSQEMRHCVEMVEKPEVFAKLMELRPDDARIWYARGRLFATRKEWSQATAHYLLTLKLRDEQIEHTGVKALAGPQAGRSVLRTELAAIVLLNGDVTGYCDLCESIVSQLDESNDAFALSQLSRACTLGPNAVADLTLPVRIARQAVATQPKNAWYLFALGCAHYRAGDYLQALERLEESLHAHPNWVGRGQNYVVLAMACQKLGPQEDAHRWLSQAQTWLKSTNETIAHNKYGYAATVYLNDWLTVLVLLPEAEALLSAEEVP